MCRMSSWRRETQKALHSHRDAKQSCRFLSHVSEVKLEDCFFREQTSEKQTTAHAAYGQKYVDASILLFRWTGSETQSWSSQPLHTKQFQILAPNWRVQFEPHRLRNLSVFNLNKAFWKSCRFTKSAQMSTRCEPVELSRFNFSDCFRWIKPSCDSQHRSFNTSTF